MRKTSPDHQAILGIICFGETILCQIKLNENNRMFYLIEKKLGMFPMPRERCKLALQWQAGSPSEETLAAWIGGGGSN